MRSTAHFLSSRFRAFFTGSASLLMAAALGFGVASADTKITGTAESVGRDDCVILLHGMARSANSMERLQHTLENAGLTVVNVDYPSTTATIEALAQLAVEQGLSACAEYGEGRIHFVTHSLGGILVRVYFRNNRAEPRLGRVVMLGPPNHGSEIIDTLHDMPGFELVNGPAAEQLGTGPEGLPSSLGAVTFELGIIAGNQSVNPLYSWMLPEDDDGKVTVDSTRVDGMKAHLVLPVTHTFMMRNPVVIDQTVHFLKTGQFFRESPSPTFRAGDTSLIGGESLNINSSTVR